ncbi:MAG: ASCH domain-containing protein [Nitrolancea sp.]
MLDSPLIAAMWSEFLASRPDLPSDLTYYEAFTFGNQPEMASELAGLVLVGTKTATSEAMRVYEESGQRPPQPGDFSIVLDGDRNPVCVTETLEVNVVPLNQVDATFADDYGEGDRSLAWWQESLWDYYEQEYMAHDWPVSKDIPLMCERFRVVFVPNPKEGSAHDA